MNWVKRIITNYVDVLKKYATFQGRATRSEFWYFQLVNFLITLIIYVPIIILSLNHIDDSIIIFLGALFLLYTLGTFLPQLGVMVRRLHDTGRSGWWYFINIIPFGSIVFLIFLTQNSKRGSNEYGENPKEQNNISNQSSPSTPSKPNLTPRKNVKETQLLSRKRLVPENDIYPIIELLGEHDISIGRNNGNNIVINNSYLSNKHLLITINAISHENDIRVLISDQNSTNGTYIDGNKLEPYSQIELNEGARLILGSEEVIYHLI